jgi:predicted dehydrogenase/RimJ/RimL family protein N-acetyltransferase
VRVAVLGQGSIGRRHAAILRELGNEVVGYDVRPNVCSVPGVSRAQSEAAALEGAHAAIVASPPSEHLRQARLALDSGVHTLVEKPFAPSAEGVTTLGVLAREHGLLLEAAMNLRFHPGISIVHRLIAKGAIGRPLRASIWCGSWLPGWRPGTDYRLSYSARRDLGGGVLLDAIHELDYAIWMLGPVVRVQALLARTSSLELDVEDVAALVLEHACGAVTSMTLDYIDHAYDRGCRVVGKEGTVHWSWQAEAVVLRPANGEPEHFAAPSNVAPSYRAELRAFVEGIGTGSAPASSVEEAAAALAVADAARLASSHGRAVEVTHPGLVLRAAQREDADELLRWRNDPATRSASFNSKEISRAEHIAWLERSLADPARRLLVAISDGVAIGQVRLDRVQDATVELHVALAPEARSHGIAPHLLVLAAREHASALKATRVVARVRADNEPSKRSFSKAGFRPCQRNTDTWWLAVTPRAGQAQPKQECASS